MKQGKLKPPFSHTNEEIEYFSPYYKDIDVIVYEPEDEFANSEMAFIDASETAYKYYIKYGKFPSTIARAKQLI